jgi:hypothetical protein
MSKKSVRDATVKRNFLLLGGALLGLFIPRPFMIGISMMITAVGFEEVMEGLEDPGPPKKSEP